MPIAGYDLDQGPANMRPHLVVKLKRKWSYNSRQRVFVEASGKKFSPKRELPKNTRIVYMIQDLAKEPTNSLSKAERDLARYLHVILPKGTDSSEYISVLKYWECVEEVRLPPEISLP